MGGTFDVLHKGHRRLLREAFIVGRRVAIGVTSDKFARSLHKPHKLDPFSVRRKELQKLLARWHVLSHAKIVQLDDRYGPAVSDKKMQAIVVSRRTISTAHRINALRRSRGLKSLKIVPIDLILADDRRPISSTRIRRGKIDREGRLR